MVWVRCEQSGGLKQNTAQTFEEGLSADNMESARTRLIATLLCLEQGAQWRPHCLSSAPFSGPALILIGFSVDELHSGTSLSLTHVQVENTAGMVKEETRTSDIPSVWQSYTDTQRFLPDNCNTLSEETWRRHLGHGLDFRTVYEQPKRAISHFHVSGKLLAASGT